MPKHIKPNSEQKIPLSTNNSIVYAANEVRPMFVTSRKKTQSSKPNNHRKPESESNYHAFGANPISLPYHIARRSNKSSPKRDFNIFIFFVLVLHLETTWNSLHVSNGWESEYLFVIIWTTGKKSVHHKYKQATTTHKNTQTKIPRDNSKRKV